jgi:hypothetical protein
MRERVVPGEKEMYLVQGEFLVVITRYDYAR